MLVTGSAMLTMEENNELVNLLEVHESLTQ